MKLCNTTGPVWTPIRDQPKCKDLMVTSAGKWPLTRIELQGVFLEEVQTYLLFGRERVLRDFIQLQYLSWFHCIRTLEWLVRSKAKKILIISHNKQGTHKGKHLRNPRGCFCLHECSEIPQMLGKYYLHIRVSEANTHVNCCGCKHNVSSKFTLLKA